MLRRRHVIRPSAIRRIVRRSAEERGFALTEVLIVMAILGTMVGGLASVSVSTTRAEVDMNMRFRAQQEARLALSQLRREARAARCVALFNAGAAFAPVAAPGPAPQIALTYGADCAAPTARVVTWCVAGDGAKFSLYRREGAPAAACAGKRVAELLTDPNVFTLTPASTTRRAALGVSFRVSADGETRVHHLRDDIVLRNSPRT